ncbi:hypothetical protein BC828DRAFT_379679 [Blastocladiella britannica]|nr:hypothetical protein BC828DRAFT_379679 [Blastocladiella britannica]
MQTFCRERNIKNMTRSLTSLILAATFAAVLATALPAAAPDAAVPVNKFTSDLSAAALAVPECKAAADAVDADAAIASCFADTTLFFSTPDHVCRGISAPGAAANAACFDAAVAAAGKLAAACPQTVDDSTPMNKDAIYKAWGNKAAATDACTVVDASATRPLALQQVYQSHSQWTSWSFTGAPSDADKKKVLCVDANKIYWRSVDSVGVAPTLYFTSLTDAQAFVNDIGTTCGDGFKVPNKH